MSELTIKLILILIPGAISTIIFGKLIVHEKWNSFNFILFSILFGFFSYLSLQIVINIINLISFNLFFIADLTIWNSLSDTKKIPYKEIGFSMIFSILIAFFISYIQNQRIINVLANKFRVTNKFGEENLFTAFLNRKDIEFVYLRDIKNNKTYSGWVESFSESENVSEILLSDVNVYTYDDSTFLYSVPKFFLSLNKTEIIIELAINKNLNDEENEQGKTSI